MIYSKRGNNNTYQNQACGINIPGIDFQQLNLLKTVVHFTIFAEKKTRSGFSLPY